MRHLVLLSAATALLRITATAEPPHPKRGLCHVASNVHSEDDQMWPQALSWYYNFGPDPSPEYGTDANMHFVPMLWGARVTDTGTPFYDNVKQQIDNGANISYVLSFNEPDGPHVSGGSNLAASLAATRWKAEIQPLKELGIKVGAPAVTGGQSGWEWLDNWFRECDGGCSPDFIPVHWYGSFEGMMSHLGQVTARWPELEVWVTEYGWPHQDLETTQTFFNQSMEAMDRWSNITHYSYFGAFRSSVSNVGSNAAMLTENGALTDIGAWYIGTPAMGNIPHGSAASLNVMVPEWFGIYVGVMVTATVWAWGMV